MPQKLHNPDALDDSAISQVTNASVQFGLVPPEHWNQPPWIDEDRASAERDELVSKNIIYGGKCLCDLSLSHVDILDRRCIVSELGSPKHECSIYSVIVICVASTLV
jgi:hypothetical protein